MAPTNERVSEATRLAEVAVSGTHVIADIGVICSSAFANDPKRSFSEWCITLGVESNNSWLRVGLDNVHSCDGRRDQSNHVRLV